ncbi:MAG: hypothetical protein DRQ10_07525 [Candidatus Hydrothermota bacterium]|nr:MAG: hypothetical protein DRQ10_07525 [Candidatus Hydrothermae bacterium]
MNTLLILAFLGLSNAACDRTVPIISTAWSFEDTTSRRGIFLPFETDPIWAKDKALHLSGSFILTNAAMTFGVARDAKGCALLVFGIGLAKEVYDLEVKKTGISLYDLFYDLMGIGLAVSFGWTR